jgi:hypothetical protein
LDWTSLAPTHPPIQKSIVVLHFWADQVTGSYLAGAFSNVVRPRFQSRMRRYSDCPIGKYLDPSSDGARKKGKGVCLWSESKPESVFLKKTRRNGSPYLHRHATQTT